MYKNGWLYCALHQKNDASAGKISVAVDIGKDMGYNKL